MKYEGGVGGGKLDLITLAALSTQGEIRGSPGRNMHPRIYIQKSTYRTFIILKRWINVECRQKGGRWEREQKEIEDQLLFEKGFYTNKCRIHFFS
jgi:hypothetical protein